MKKRLRTTEEDFKKSQTDKSRYLETIKEVFSKVSPHIEAELKPVVKKEEEEAAAAAAAAAANEPDAVNGTETVAATAMASNSEDSEVNQTKTEVKTQE